MASSLTDALLAEMAPSARKVPEGFEAQFERQLRAVQAAVPGRSWPALEAFAAFVGSRLGDDEAWPGTLELLCLEDLALVFLCLRQDEVALAALERRFLSGLPLQLVRNGFSQAVADETRLRLAEKLVVGRAGGAPQLATYTGRSSLGHWLRVVALREAVKTQGRDEEREPLGDQALELETSEEDPELRLFKARFRSEFAEAFRLSLERLPQHARLVLRQYFLDGLSIDELASLHRVHRSTAARWVAEARHGLVAKVKQKLQASLRVNASEVTSLVRAIRTGFDVSLRRHL